MATKIDWYCLESIVLLCISMQSSHHLSYNWQDHTHQLILNLTVEPFGMGVSLGIVHTGLNKVFSVILSNVEKNIKSYTHPQKKCKIAQKIAQFCIYFTEECTRIRFRMDGELSYEKSVIHVFNLSTWQLAWGLYILDWKLFSYYPRFKY